MLRKINTAFLRLVAMILLCALVLTGCLGTEDASPDHSGGNAEYLTPDSAQNAAFENTEPEIITTVHEHSFDAATCTLAKTCSVCGATEGEPLGHTWTAATCTTPATCSVCAETDGNANGHTWKPATCTTPITCDSCGQTDGEPLEHSWRKATCTTASTCEYCGQTTGTVIDHNWREATCTEAATCIACGKTKGSAASHQYSKGKCSKCGEKDPFYDDSASTMVWIPTRGGKKYHAHSGCSNMKDPEKVSLSKAKRLGFTACKKCY